MNTFVRTLLFASAFAPALGVNIAVQIYTAGANPPLLYLLAAAALSCALPFVLVAGIAQQFEKIPFEAKKVESQDWLLVVFVVSYFIPLITHTHDYGLLVLIIVAAAALLACIDSIPCHPLLHIFKYRFYKVEGANGMVYTLITRRHILNAKAITSVHQISATMLMEAGR